MTVQAKVRCTSVSPPPWDTGGTARIARFTPVWDPDPGSPNHQWSQATPAGYLELTITRPAAAGLFEPDREYLLTFDPAPPPAPPPPEMCTGTGAGAGAGAPQPGIRTGP
jgi:hypothetical protein